MFFHKSEPFRFRISYSPYITVYANSTNMLLNISICFFSLLVLHKLIKIYSESLMEKPRIKMQPSLLVSCFFLTVKVSFTVKKKLVWKHASFEEVPLLKK